MVTKMYLLNKSNNFDLTKKKPNKRAQQGLIYNLNVSTFNKLRFWFGFIYKYIHTYATTRRTIVRNNSHRQHPALTNAAHHPSIRFVHGGGGGCEDILHCTLYILHQAISYGLCARRPHITSDKHR